MTKALAGAFAEGDRDKPIGALAGNWLSIINVSEIPLDPAAYQQLIAKGEVELDATQRPSLEQWLQLMYSFQLFKGGPVGTRRNEDFANEVEKHIKDDFRCRVATAVGCDTKLVVFLGATAKRYFEQLCPDVRISSECASHPSPRPGNTNGWQICEKVKQSIKDTVSAFRQGG